MNFICPFQIVSIQNQIIMLKGWSIILFQLPRLSFLPWFLSSIRLPEKFWHHLFKRKSITMSFLSQQFYLLLLPRRARQYLRSRFLLVRNKSKNCASWLNIRENIWPQKHQKVLKNNVVCTLFWNQKVFCNLKLLWSPQQTYRLI